MLSAPLCHCSAHRPQVGLHRVTYDSGYFNIDNTPVGGSQVPGWNNVNTLQVFVQVWSKELLDSNCYPKCDRNAALTYIL